MMKKNLNKPYDNFSKNDLILRDHLAADRTILACERTLLAYIRTTLTAFIAGLTIIKFFEGIYYKYLGFAFVVVGVIVTIYGIKSYLKLKLKIEKFTK
ncbi:MAG: putative membrane protein [Candidatus Berkelbacteria bacterium Athens1014_28]|uniref:Putative membrane protein n=1 Tax=Candidatus Berkelbacteria bacterium Athens1014_28 TaxID=2017145 RepID=A0A554LK90_9BACT|nr:MAG: putative membrane protein [Candidatus Berkelbacteria bacterium Athens1014_28]